MKRSLLLRNKLLWLLLCLSQSLSTQAQTWTIKQPIPNTPASGRWSPMCFSLNNKIYVGGGYTGNLQSMKDFWEYDPALDQWTRRKDLPALPNRTAGIGFAANGKGYVGLGSINYNSLNASFVNDLLEYDPAADDWNQKLSLPDSGRHHSACFVVGNKAYIVGGNTDYPYVSSNDVWEYDVVNNTWTAKAPFPAAYVSNAMAFSIGTNGYVVGGHVKRTGASGDGDADSSTYMYNTINDTWTRKADFCRRSESGVGFSINGVGYVGFGMSKDSLVTHYYEEFCKYNPATDSWDSAASYPNIAREYAIAAVANGKAYAGAGFLYFNSEIYKNDWAELNVGNVSVPSVFIQEISISPNPINDQLRVRSNKDMVVSMLNMFGQCVQILSLKAGITLFDVSMLSDGIYMIPTPGKTFRIFVQH